MTLSRIQTEITSTWTNESNLHQQPKLTLMIRSGFWTKRSNQRKFLPGRHLGTDEQVHEPRCVCMQPCIHSYIWTSMHAQTCLHMLKGRHRWKHANTHRKVLYQPFCRWHTCNFHLKALTMTSTENRIWNFGYELLHLRSILCHSPYVPCHGQTTYQT